MNKILLIIQREYLSRVRKKSFILMTILGPILIAAIMIIPIYINIKEKSVQKIMVVDDSKIFRENPIRSTADIKMELSTRSLDEARKALPESDYAAILWIPENIVTSPSVVFYYKKTPALHVQTHVRTEVEQTLIDLKLIDNNIDKHVLANLQSSSRVKILTKLADEKGDIETNMELDMFIGMGAGVLIYMFIFLYGVQVMRGVIEEKTNRIVEVIISSVKPFQLMMGKIVGVALVGLTQFLLWMVLTSMLFMVGQATILKDISKQMMTQELKQEEVMKRGADIRAMKEAADNPMSNYNEFKSYKESFDKKDFGNIVLCFLFFFLGGYLLYSALFAAVGAAVDSEADSQQFMLPVTVPLILSFVLAQNIIRDPDSPIAFWLSIIPFTSPVAMMVRLPFGVPAWQVALSMTLLVLGFLFTTWIAGRIYRTGILMYGKKVSYQELWKWLFYKG